VLKRTTLIVLLLAALCAPCSAETRIFIWKDLDGNWNVPANCTAADGGPAAFPNAIGDQALFSAAYSGPRAVTLQSGMTFSVGEIYFTDRAITINAPGTGGLRMNTNLITGNVEIGPGTNGNPTVAELIVLTPNQIADTSHIVVKRQGQLLIDASDRIGHVDHIDGFVHVRNDGVLLTMASLTMVGGTVMSDDGGSVKLDGALTATSSTTYLSRFSRTGTGVFDIGQFSKIITVDDGPSTATYELSIDMPIVAGHPLGGVTKEGSGGLRFAGDNTYTGQTNVTKRRSPNRSALSRSSSAGCCGSARS
jgi:autotransporter-associated beta strand protein